MAEYAVVTVREAVVRVYTAQSQSVKAMGAKAFQDSKTKVLDALGYRIDIVRKGFPARMGGSESDQRAQGGQSTEAPEAVSR